MAKDFPAIPVFQSTHPRRTYVAPFSVNATAAVDLLSIKPPAGTIIRIRQITIDNAGAQTSASVLTIQYGYADNVGSGGSAATVGNYGIGDGDASSSSTVRSGDTTQAANFVQMGAFHVFVPGTNPNASTSDFEFHPEHRPPTIAGDAAKPCFVLRHPGAAGSAGFAGFVEWTEEAA